MYESIDPAVLIIDREIEEAHNMREKIISVVSNIVLSISATVIDQVEACTGEHATYELQANEPVFDTFVKIHIGFDPRTYRVYVEWYFDFRLNHIFDTERDNVNYYIRRNLVNLFEDLHYQNKWNLEIVLPEDKETLVTDTTCVITPRTINVWEQFFHHKCFLEDKVFTEHCMLPKKIEAEQAGEIFDKTPFFEAVRALQEEYQLDENSSNQVDEVYERYRELFFDFFDYDLYEHRPYDINTHLVIIFDERVEET